MRNKLIKSLSDTKHLIGELEIRVHRLRTMVTADTTFNADKYRNSRNHLDSLQKILEERREEVNRLIEEV